jgi:tetratricopeptide (TPR) repeat protein
MRRRFVTSLVLLAAVEFGLAAWGLADENGPSTPAPSNAVGVGNAATPEGPNNAAAEDPSSTGAPAEPQGRVPRLAKRNPIAGTPAGTDDGQTRPGAGDAAPAATPPAGPRPGDAPAAGGEPLRPIPDPQQGAPVSVEAASFKGVTPGVTTKADVRKAWGPPKASTVADGSPVELYAVEPFKRVEVHYAADKVSAIVIRLGRTFPADAVAKTLELEMVRPVSVSNDMGEVLGRAYPERGVMFDFAPAKKPGQPLANVAQIIIEPVSAETFVLRAETMIDTRYDLARHDLEQALALEPGNARAHWLLARVLAAGEDWSKAVVEASAAVQLEPQNPQYRVSLAQFLVRANRLGEALDEAHKAIDLSADRPHIRARATCLVGDLTASGPNPDFKKALSFHTRAIQLADPLRGDPHPAIRWAAKEVFVDAHLGAAHDIAWGPWKDKSKALARWLELAAAEAKEMAAIEGSGPELLFRVHSQALAAYVGLRGELDPELEVRAVLDAGGQWIAAAHDPVQKLQAQRELGLALYDAVQIAQSRTDHTAALRYGEAAVEYLAMVNETKPSPTASFLLGRLYFRLGAIHALRDGDHKAAVAWFDKALPLLDRPSPDNVAADISRQGEAFVSMGVSYWQVGQRDKAVYLTQQGIRWMEQAVEQHTLDRTAMVVPYSNLAAMHRALGAKSDADRFQEMASRAKEGNLK